MARAEVEIELRQSGIIADVSQWRKEIRDWRKLRCDALAQQWKELHERVPAPQTPRLYSTHLRSDAGEIQRRQLRLEGLLNAVVLGNLQACEECSYWTPSFEAPNCQRQRLHAPLSRALAPLRRAVNAPARVEVIYDQDMLQICRSCALRGQRTALVHLVPGEERPLPLGLEMRDSQLYLRTTYFHAYSEMPRQMHQTPKEVLNDGKVIHTAHVSILRGDVAEGAPWLEPVEIEVLTASLQRTPQGDGHEQYARIREKAAVARTIDDIFSSATEWGIEVLVFPPLGVNGAPCGCYHPPSDAGQLLRQCATQAGDFQVYVAKQHLAPLVGWLAFADAVTNGRAALQRVPPIPMYLSPYYNCYVGKKPDFLQFTLRKGRLSKRDSATKADPGKVDDTTKATMAT